MLELPVLHGKRVMLRPLGDGDLDALVEIVQAPGVAEWWGFPAPEGELREELRCDEPGGGAFAIDVEGELAGWLGLYETAESQYRFASLDIVLAPAFPDRGLGSEALRLAIRWLAGEREHHRFTIDPAAHNERAIRCYEAVGFRTVGVMRAYERGVDGTWHDNLLMDLLADELREPRDSTR
jgi:aminoglycoside 6'-N-acetyltransferase